MIFASVGVLVVAGFVLLLLPGALTPAWRVLAAMSVTNLVVVFWLPTTLATSPMRVAVHWTMLLNVAMSITLLAIALVLLRRPSTRRRTRVFGVTLLAAIPATWYLVVSLIGLVY